MNEALAISRDTHRTGGGEALVVEVSGELDLAAAERFASELRPDETSELRAVIVDLAAVRFIDSSGIRVLLQTERDLDEAGYRFGVIVEEGSAVARALELAVVAEMLTSFDTRAEALEELVA